jgi:hypothetical protein
MEPIVGTGHGAAPRPFADASQREAAQHESEQGNGSWAEELAAAAESPATAGSRARSPVKEPGLGPLAVRLGFVLVFVIAAVALIATGYTAVAAVEVLLGAGLTAVEILKRLS